MDKQSKFIKEGNQIFYIDKYGRKWGRESIDDLFELATKKVKLDNSFEYYAFKEE